MANIITEQLAEATFEGIRFRVRTEAISRQGRRVILHEYLDSDRIFAEDIGEIPPNFSVDAFIHSDRDIVPGQIKFPNFIQKAEQFRNVLRQKREYPGLLTLPTIGTFQAIALEFSEDRSQEAVGEIRFTIEFVKAAGSIVTAEAPPNVFGVFTVTDSCRLELQLDAIKKWEGFVLNIDLPDLEINAYLAALNDLASLPTDIANKARNFLQAGTFGRIKDTIRNFTNALPNLLRIPGDLFGYLITGVEDVLGLFQDLSNAFSEEGSSNAFDLASDLGRSGSGLPTDMNVIRDQSQDENESTIDSFEKPNWDATTIQRQQRNDARNLLLDTFRTCWYLTALEQAAIADYQTDLEVDEARADLEELYKNVVLANTANEKSFLSSLSVLSLINQARRITLGVLDQKEQTAYKVITINYRHYTSALNIAYQLYAEEITSISALHARADLIASLNPDQRPDLLFGDVTVLQVR